MQLSNAAELNEIMQPLLERLRKENTSTAFDLWLSKLRLCYLSDEAAVFASESMFKCKVIQEKYGDAISAHLNEMLGFAPKVSVLFEQDLPSDLSVFCHGVPEEIQNRKNWQSAAEQTENEMDVPEKPDEAEKTTPTPADEKAAESSGKSDDSFGYYEPDTSLEYTLENYVVGNSNRFAHACCTAVARNPSAQKIYNPLFIHGQSGLGKTHLMYAICNYMRKNFPGLKIIYIKCEEFTNQLIESIANKKMAEFREKYRNIDVLIIDDIQFLSGKESTQEEFFHTFNTLYEANKQIIVTSDRPPKDISILEDRILTRFEQGLMADVQPPDFELRLAILMNKADAMGITISSDVLTFLANSLQDNIRQLEGVVKKLGAISLLSGENIDMQLVQRLVPEFMREKDPPEVTAKRIISAVSKKYNVPVDDITGSKRTKNIAMARHIAIYITRTTTDLSLPAIGKLFGGRDHTTVMASVSIIENSLINNYSLDLEIQDIIKEIK